MPYVILVGRLAAATASVNGVAPKRRDGQLLLNYSTLCSVISVIYECYEACM